MSDIIKYIITKNQPRKNKKGRKLFLVLQGKVVQVRSTRFLRGQGGIECGVTAAQATHIL